MVDLLLEFNRCDPLVREMSRMLVAIRLFLYPWTLFIFLYLAIKQQRDSRFNPDGNIGDPLLFRNRLVNSGVVLLERCLGYTRAEEEAQNRDLYGARW